MTLKELAKKALLHFKNKNYVFTPKEYEEVFCKLARQNNILIDDCNRISKYISKLDKKYQIIARSYNIKTLEELVVFLINYLNKSNVDQEKENLNQLFLYSKRVLEVISILPFKKSKEIALRHLKVINPFIEKEEWQKLREEWIEFLSEFDDKTVKKGAKIAGINSEDVFDVIEALIEKLKTNELDLSHLVDILIFALTPSYAPAMNDEIAVLKRQLKENPEFILSKAFVDDLKALTKKRISLDKEELRKRVRDLNQIAERLSLKVLRLLEKTDGSSQKVKKVRFALENWRKSSEDNIENVKNKLLKIVISLDEELDAFNINMRYENEDIERLKNRIKLLEKEIEKLRQEVKTDFLTNLINKRALEEELQKQESLFKRYKAIYSVVFFDIDHFKSINDTYGHEAGDVILKSLGLILRRYSRDVDVIGRFGGEEFVAILPHTEKDGAYKFAEKLRQIVENTKFMYKNTRIKVTVSGGVASRNEVNSKEELLKKADERLYLAKQNGRNRICKEDKCENK